MTIRYNTYLQIFVSRVMRQELQAVAFQIGQKGMFSRSAKMFLQKGLDEYKASLTPQKKKIFDEILANIQLKDGLEGGGPGTKRNLYVRKKDRVPENTEVPA